MKPTVFAKLSLMMLLEYFIWSSWYVTMSTYMKVNFGASDAQIGLAYGALAIATMISPLFLGMVADRYFAAQRMTGVLHTLGALLLYFASSVTSNNLFYWIILFYSLLYMPTIALTNSIAFHQMTDPGKQFPWIRVFGTIGWIVAGLTVGFLRLEKTASTFHIAALASFVLGIFSFALPHTPPKGKTSSAVRTDALALLKDKSYLIFISAAVLVCIPLAFYYGFTNLFLNELGMENAAGKMILGQVSEAVFILAIPFLFNRIGVKKMLILGMAAWILRYAFFAYGNVGAYAWMLFAGIVLHGICYDFFFVTGYMYTEKKADTKIKSAAQGLFTFATYGLGMFIGTWISGWVVNRYSLETMNSVTGNNDHRWMSIWLIPACIALAVLIYFILFFREKKEIKIAKI